MSWLRKSMLFVPKVSLCFGLSFAHMANAQDFEHVLGEFLMKLSPDKPLIARVTTNDLDEAVDLCKEHELSTMSEGHALVIALNSAKEIQKLARAIDHDRSLFETIEDISETFMSAQKDEAAGKVQADIKEFLAKNLEPRDVGGDEELITFLTARVFPDPMFQKSPWSYLSRWEQKSRLDEGLKRYLGVTKHLIDYVFQVGDGWSFVENTATAYAAPAAQGDLFSKCWPQQKASTVSPLIRDFLTSKWSHMRDDFDSIVSYIEESILADPLLYADSSKYLAAWSHARGFTEELRIPEDIAKRFFGELCASGRLEVFLEKAKAGHFRAHNLLSDTWK